jgi:hypothetical protein
MFRCLFVTAVATALAVPPAFAAPAEPGRADIARAAEACTVQGAFGLKFGETFRNASTRQAGAEWTPFQTLTVSTAPRTEQVFEIEATASFARALMSNEDRIALARWVFKAIDTEITTKRGFATRQPRQNGVAYTSASGFVLDLSRDGTEIFLTCTDAALKQRARMPIREDVREPY